MRSVRLRLSPLALLVALVVTGSIGATTRASVSAPATGTYVGQMVFRNANGTPYSTPTQQARLSLRAGGVASVQWPSLGAGGCVHHLALSSGSGSTYTFVVYSTAGNCIPGAVSYRLAWLANGSIKVRLTYGDGLRASGTLVRQDAGVRQKGQLVSVTVLVTGVGALHLGATTFSCSATQPACTKSLKVKKGSKLLVRAQAPTGAEAMWAAGCKGIAVACNLEITKPTHVAITFVALGAETNPIPLGTAAAINGGWRLTVTGVTLDADAQVLAVVDPYFGGPANNPLPPGAQYSLVTISATYAWGGSSDLGDLQGVGSQGATYSPDGCEPPAPTLDSVESNVFSGQTITANLCFKIAANDAGVLMLTADAPVQNYIESQVWFALR